MSATDTRGRKPRFKLTGEIPREWPLQAQIARVLAIEIAPAGHISKDNVCWFSIDHSNHAGQVPGARLSRGIIAGIPDTLVLHCGRAFLIEIKTLDGVLSEDQQHVIATCYRAGACVGVARDYVEFLACLDEWQIPRNRRVREG